MNLQVNSFGYFNLNLFVSRYLCGNGCLSDYNSVTRKQLFLVSSHSGYREVNSVALQNQITNYYQSHNKLLKSNTITEEVLLDMHKALTPKYSSAGEFRRRPCWLGQGPVSNAERVFPPVKYITPLMNSWFDFMNNKKNSIESRAIWGHSHLLAIHPFGDGNGRVSRCLLGALLEKELNLTVNPILFRLHSGTSDYQQAIRQMFDDKKLTHEPICEYWREAILWSNEITKATNLAFSLAQQQIYQLIGMRNLSKQSVNLIKYLWSQPIICEHGIVNDLGLTMLQSKSVISELCELKILTPKRVISANQNIIFECEIILTAMLKIDKKILNKTKKATNY